MYHKSLFRSFWLEPYVTEDSIKKDKKVSEKIPHYSYTGKFNT